MRSRLRTSWSRARATRALLCVAALATALVVSDQPVRTLSSTIVISQVYGGGGNTGATYRNDFVELFNRGNVAVDVTGWTVQYASATGNTWQKTTLSGTINPGQYYLVQQAQGTGGTVALPTPDAVGTVTMSATAGKVALLNHQTALTCSTGCAAGGGVVDFVGFGGTASDFEGAPTPTLSNTTAAIRGGSGCTETDSNVNDFAVAAPNPRNSSSPVAVCEGSTPPGGTGLATPSSLDSGLSTLLTVAVTPGANPSSTGLAVSADLSAIGGSNAQAFYDDGTNGDVAASDNTFSFRATVAPDSTAGAKSLAATITDAQARTGTASIALTVTVPVATSAIHTIQGSGTMSPFAGQVVRTQGIVTARRFNNGFFLQAPEADYDADPNTSEAIFVFTSSVPPVAAAVGALVQVTGTVQEFSPSVDPLSPPITELIGPTVVVLGGPVPLPAAVELTSADLPTTGTIEQLERLEGMRVHVPSLRVVAPSEGNTNETSATGSTTGIFHGVIEPTGRPFREAGIQAGDPLPKPGIPRFDANPERLRVNSRGQVGAAAINVTSDALVSNVTGVLDYAFRTWTVLTDVATPPTASNNITASAVPVADANEFTIGSFNMERFFDDSNDPAIGEPVLTATAFQNRLQKASLAIRDLMRAPDVIGVQEIENLSTLQAIAARINADAVAGGGSDPGYQAYLVEGNDIGGIDVGVLVKSSRVAVVEVRQEGKDATYVNPVSAAQELLNDRPPLVLEALVTGPAGTLPLTVIVNHLRSLNGVEEICGPAPCEGDRVRAKRLAQAEFLAKLIQARQVADPAERIVSVGDYNAFEVNDGYVDVIGSILGTPAPADSVTLAGADLVDPDLVDLVTSVPPAQRYSYVFEGSAQVLDHVIANQPAALRFARLQFARANADFPESYRGDATRPERLSDHDMPVAYFAFPGAPVLQLNGANPMQVECCGTFTDPGAVATDQDFGDLSSEISVTGAVDTTQVGTYELTYSVTNGYATTTTKRTVNVVDTIPPVLTLLGDAPMTIEVGSGPFVDPGATAADTCAGDLVNWITVGGTVDTTKVGTYAITYSTSDGYNITAVTRLVYVVDRTKPVVSEVTPSTRILWPPNHQMVPVRLTYSVTDNSGAATCTVGVISDEGCGGHGDRDDSGDRERGDRDDHGNRDDRERDGDRGNHGGHAGRAPDWVVVNATLVKLRAERSAHGDGRVYTVTVTCRDASGNVGTSSTTVSVPKSRRK